MEAGRSAVIGLGNPYLRDDAVGLEVARRVHAILDDPSVDVLELAVGGLELVEVLTGYRHAVVVDAIVTEEGKVGDLFLLDLDGSTSSQRTGMTHELGLLEGLEMSRRLHMPIPETLRVYAIQVKDPFTFSEEMTEEVASAVPRVSREIADEVAPLLCG